MTDICETLWSMPSSVFSVAVSVAAQSCIGLPVYSLLQ